MDDFESIECIAKLRARDQVVCEKYIKHFTSPLFKSAIGLGFSKEEAEDIIQGTWIVFFEVLERFEGRSKLKTFLYGILYNKASEYKKKNFRLKDSFNIDEVLEEKFNTRDHWIKGPIQPEKISFSTQLRDIISKCLELLPINQKLAFQLKEIEENDTDEICQILNISTSNLGVLLYRARNQLRICVEGKTEGEIHD